MADSSKEQAAGGGSLAVHCGRLIDGTGSPPREGVSLVVEGSTIRDVLPTERWKVENQGRPARELDATGATVLPGLMDIHLHLCSIVDPDEPNTWLALWGANSPLLTLHAAKNARLMLEAGFTTVRDLAGFTNHSGVEMVALRRAIEIGLVPGARVFAAGWVGQTAGHHDAGGHLPTWPRPAGLCVDGPWEARRQVREMVRNGVDLIKTAASGGAGFGEERWWRNHTLEELEAICDEAHAYGRKVAVHVHTADGMKRALRAGADTLEHGTNLDDEVIGLMADRGAFLIPTLSYRSPRGLAARMKGSANPELIRKHRESVGVGYDMIGKAHRAGVRVACGTDTYTSLRMHWGENAYELEMLVQAELSPMDAILAATRVSAEALGQEKRLGTLEPGKVADLLVFDGDPLADIRLLQERERILVVIKDGAIAVDRRDPRPV